MRFNDKKLIMFDLDGTLIDSAPDLALAINHMLVALKRDIFSQDIIRSWVGNGAQILVKRALLGKMDHSEDLDSALLEEAVSIFLDFYKNNLCVETVTYPHVRATLKILKAQGYRLAIVTNKPFAFIEPILKGLQLEGIFELCVGGDTLSVRKPDPQHLLYVCEKLGVSYQQCVMVGDSRNDILAANAANMQSIGLTYGYNYGEDISLHKPDAVCSDFADMIAMLAEKNEYELID
ncbi:phosphoglycolate phosphatase [Psychromonas sp. CNPT3]|uniref:phosphoglycolate phosphatase n=1 Tax=Psychromonas sp. CNPT3 TaxID=314282 RepID=UPI00006E8096|nr:phosphoglycolate phosphatase [Psychromonas sp. CNPT3]AGH80822.1 phosphoglycolate phosphatase [Psychromonas sp. CNPT3]